MVLARTELVPQSWRELSGGRIEFTIRRLSIAD
jgi:hypothetical protein